MAGTIGWRTSCPQGWMLISGRAGRGEAHCAAGDLAVVMAGYDLARLQRPGSSAARTPDELEMILNSVMII